MEILTMSNLSCTFYSNSSYRSTCNLNNFPDETRAFIFAGDTIDNLRSGITNFINNVVSINYALSSIPSSTNSNTYRYKEVTGSTLTYSGLKFYSLVLCSLSDNLNVSTCTFGESQHQLSLKNTNNNGVNVFAVVTSYDSSIYAVQRFDNLIANINLTFAASIPQLTLTFNLSNCTVSPETTSYLFPISQILTITPTQGYVFENVPTIAIGSNTYNFNVSDNVATFDLSVLNYNTSVTGIVTSNCYEYIIADITVNSSNCVVTYEPDVFEKNKTLTISVVAEDTYYFPIAPSVYLNCYNLSSETLTMNKINDYTYTITLSGDWADVHGGFFVNITADASFNTDLAKKYGLITIYKPDRDILINLSRLRIYSYSTSQRTLVDLGQFITSMKAIYINTDIVGKSDIILGNTDTNILCPLINDDLISLDLGNVTINGYYNNNIDVLHSQIVVTLPFIGVVNLDSDIYINKTVKIVYKVNLITAKCVADIYIFYENKWILKDSFSGVIGMNIPYILQDNSFDNMNFKQTDVNNDLFRAIPQINVFENTKVNENETIFDTDKEVLISELPTNTDISINEIVETHNVSVINKNDYELIIQALKEGVII